MEALKDFEMYVHSIGLKISEVDENVINDYCTGLFYDALDEDDIEELNEIEEELRKIYLGE